MPKLTTVPLQRAKGAQTDAAAAHITRAGEQELRSFFIKKISMHGWLLVEQVAREAS